MARGSSDALARSERGKTLIAPCIFPFKVGKGIPEFTPVEIPLAGYLSRRGISHVSLKQEPQSLQGLEDVRSRFLRGT